MPLNELSLNCNNVTVNVCEASHLRETYISSHEKALVISFLKSFGEDHAQIFDETRQNSSMLLSMSLLNGAKSYNTVSKNLKKYSSLQKHNKVTEFSKNVIHFDKIREDIGCKIINAINIKIESFHDIAVLRKNAEEKEKLFKTISLFCQQFVSFIDTSSFSRNLVHRVQQMESIVKSSMHRSNFEAEKIICFNDTTLTWPEAFKKLCGDEYRVL